MTSAGAGRRLAVIGATLVVAGLAPVGGGPGRPHPVAASCVPSAVYMGAAFAGAQAVPISDLAGRVGDAAIPPCIDTIPPPPVIPAAVAVPALRVRGVAPRYAIAVRFGPGSAAALLVAPRIGCPTSPGRRRLLCLRHLTARLRSGPVLVAPLSAAQGEVVPVTLRVADRRRRRNVAMGLDMLLQRWTATGWRTAFRLIGGVRTDRPPDPVPAGDPVPPVPSPALLGGGTLHVRIPETEPGVYRLASRVSASRPAWLTSVLTIRDLPGPCSYCAPG